MDYNTLTPDQLTALSTEQIRAMITRIGHRIHLLHYLVQCILLEHECAQHSTEWHGGVLVRKQLYCWLQEMQRDPSLT